MGLIEVKETIKTKHNTTIVSVTGAFILLFITILYFYKFLHRIPYPLSIYAPETMLAFVIGISCSIYENRIKKRLLSCLLVAIIGFLLSTKFAILMIYGVFICAGIVCGTGEINYGTLKISLIKFFRVIIVILGLIVGFVLPLPHGGSAGSGFTEYHNTFLVIVFLPVIFLFIFDTIIKKMFDGMVNNTDG